MQNKKSQGQKVVSPVLNRVAKWAIFVLNSAGVWRPRRHSTTHTSLECPPRIFLVLKSEGYFTYLQLFARFH